MTEKWREQKKAELKSRIARLANKIVFVTTEVKKFGPKKVRRGMKLVSMSRGGVFKHWHKMAVRSLAATAKKIGRLKEELNSL